MVGTFFARTTAGGRASARRPLACGLAAALLIAAAAAPAAASDPDTGGNGGNGHERVAVEESDGTYTLSARFTAPVSPAVVLAVLTDYDNIPRFLPNVRTSRVLERDGTRVLVEQEAVVKLMLFSARVHLLLGIDEGPRSLRFVDRSGKSFERYEGAWTVAEREAGVEIVYTLTARPTFEAPGFVIRRLMRRDADDQIRRLVEEMTSRAAAGTPVAAGTP